MLDEFNIEELDERNKNVQHEFLEVLRDRGCQIVRISVPIIKYMLPFYFTLIPAEAATNLSRFDGVKYGNQPEFLEGEELADYVSRVRTDAFGTNVKRRVILGNFLLSSRFEHFNEKVRQAQRVRRLFIEEWCKKMEQ